MGAIICLVLLALAFVAFVYETDMSDKKGENT